MKQTGAVSTFSMKDSKDSFLVLRGLVALSIFASHFVAIPDLANEIGRFAKNWIAFFGTFRVPVFYAISGFALYASYLSRLGSVHQVKDFYFRRFMRIAPLFYFAIVAWTIIRFLLKDPIDVFSIFSSFSLCFNLFPTQTDSAVWGGWSVGVEVIFYVVFPVILLFIKNMRSAFCFLLLCVCISTLSYVFLSDITEIKRIAPFRACSFLSNVVYFSIGIAVFFVSSKVTELDFAKKERNRKLILVLLFLSLILSFIFLRELNFMRKSEFELTALYRLLWAFPIFLTLQLATFLKLRGNLLLPIKKIGEWSYSFYLMHLIVFSIVMNLTKSIFKVHPATLFNVWIWFFLVVLLTSFISYLTYNLIETKFLSLGKKLQNKISFSVVLPVAGVLFISLIFFSIREYTTVKDVLTVDKAFCITRDNLFDKDKQPVRTVSTDSVIFFNKHFAGVDSVSISNGKITMEGWALFPGKTVPASGIVLFGRNEERTWTPLLLSSRIRVLRADIRKYFSGDSLTEFAGWRLSGKIDGYEEGIFLLAAYSADENKFYQIPVSSEVLRFYDPTGIDELNENYDKIGEMAGDLVAPSLSFDGAPPIYTSSAFIESYSVEDENLVVSGWDFSPEDKLPFDAVMLFKKDASGQYIRIGISERGRSQRPDIKELFRCPTALWAGWKLLVPAAEIKDAPALILAGYSHRRNSYTFIATAREGEVLFDLEKAKH